MTDAVAPDAIDEAATAMFHQTMPLTAALGIEVVSNAADEVRSRMAWSPERCTVGGVLHGGALMTLADATAAAVAFANLPEGANGTTTIESKTNFLRAVRGGHANARSRLLHAGRRVIVVETEIVDDDERLVAKMTQTQAVLT